MELTSNLEKACYLIGHQIGNGLLSQGIDVMKEALFHGLTEALSGQAPRMSADEIDTCMTLFQGEMARKAEEKSQEAAASGRAFLESNRRSPGVTELPSGLQYKIIREGTGKKPSATSTVTTHYRGTLVDGTEFDSSHSRGEPASFPVNRVIRGWTEALQLMSVGSEWELYIPSELAYGDKGAPPRIPPHSTLVFRIDLLECN